MILFVCSVLVVRCFVIVVSYCCCVVSPPPSLPSILSLFTLTLQTWLIRWLRWWRRPPSVLPLLLRPPFTLRASSHIHLPLLCLCLSILWCDPRRHGLTKLDELRSVLSSSSPSSFSKFFFFYFYSPCTSSWLALPTHLPSSQSSFLFPLRSPPLSRTVCTLNCSVDDVSGFFVISHFFILLQTDCVGLQFIDVWSWSHQCDSLWQILIWDTYILSKKKHLSEWQQNLIWTVISSSNLLHTACY